LPPLCLKGAGQEGSQQSIKKSKRSNSQPVKKNDVSNKKRRLGRKTAIAHSVWRVIR